MEFGMELVMESGNGVRGVRGVRGVAGVGLR